MKIESIGIVGTGVIGSSWAAFYASKGFNVNMWDVDATVCQNGHRQAVAIIKQLQTQGALSDDTVDESIMQINVAGGLEQAVENVQLVQESVAENYEIKKQVFKALDAHTDPAAILASSSSGLLMTPIQQATHYPGRCLIAHPFNPPHLIPLVELVPGDETEEQAISKMKIFYEGLGKVPVVLKKAVPGHLANRLAMALWREAVDLVANGIASVEDVDKAVSAGPGLRWAVMGPHMIYHLGGGAGGMDHFIDHFAPAVKVWWESLASWTSLPPEAKGLLVDGLKAEMGDRTLSEVNQWRDEKLVQMLKVLYEK
jgi:3-hydroxyacyl-CoA dehydrogenase